MIIDADKVIAESEVILRSLFKQLDLTPDEKEFVNAAARKLVNTVWDLLMEVPDKKRGAMRGVITSLAIAMAGGAKELK